MAKCSRMCFSSTNRSVIICREGMKVTCRYAVRRSDIPNHSFPEIVNQRHLNCVRLHSLTYLENGQKERFGQTCVPLESFVHTPGVSMTMGAMRCMWSLTLSGEWIPRISHPLREVCFNRSTRWRNGSGEADACSLSMIKTAMIESTCHPKRAATTSQLYGDRMT